MNDKITFKQFTQQDVSLFYRWAEKPHVKNTWFQEGYEKKEAILEKIAGNGYDYPFLILVDDKPIGYIQCEDLTTFFKANPDCKNKYYFNEPEGTYCIDLFIGEEDYLGKGYGTKIITQFSNWLLTKPEVKKLVIDPSTSNKKAIHCYEKAGFKYARTAKDDVDEYYVMEKTRTSYLSDAAENIFLKIATENDVENILKTFEVWHKTRKQFIDYLSAQNDGESILIIAMTAKNEVVGYANLFWKSRIKSHLENKIPEIVDLNVITEYQRQGIATKLIHYLENIAYQKKFPVIGIAVEPTQDYLPAKQLYNKLGYIDDGKCVLPNGEKVLVLRKNLRLIKT